MTENQSIPEHPDALTPASATDAQKQASKPKWLQLLEQESWQAELLVSGVAIFGAFQLLGVINQLTDFLLAYLPNEMIGWMPYFFIWYLCIGMVSLVISFVAHFMMRSFWIGIIGLSSVYPRGVQRREDLFGPAILRKIMEKNPDLLAYSRKLDDQCSLMFAGSFLFTIMMIGFALSIAITVLLAYLLSLVLPWHTEQLSMAIAGVVVVFIYLNTILSTKGMRQRSWVQKVHYPIYLVNLFFSYSIFYKAGSVLALTFRTNAKSDGLAILRMSVFTILVMLCSIPVLIGSNALDFIDKDFALGRDRDFQLFSDAYLDQREPGQRIIYPVLSSFEQSGSALKVFIPELNRESAAFEAVALKWEPDDSLSREQNRKAERRLKLKSQSNYHQFFINDTPVENPSLFDHRHTNKAEKGIIAVIPAANFNIGLNELRIQKQFMTREGKPTQIRIPFVYAPE